VRQRGWSVVHARLVLQRKTSYDGSLVSVLVAPGDGHGGAWRRVPSCRCRFAIFAVYAAIWPCRILAQSLGW
jgi:hypothetical protein